MRRFFIQKLSIDKQYGTITGPDVKHIKSVLRLHVGEILELFDGNGSTYQAKIINISPAKVDIEILNTLKSITESPVKITVAQSILKDKKMDLIARQLTEIGITTWQPFLSQRSVARPDPKRFFNRMQRWEKIIQESLKQCKRNNFLKVGNIITFDQLLENSHVYDLKIIFWENERLSFVPLQINPKTILIVLGPEGGFTEEEIKKAGNKNFIVSSLGPRILKADTAAIVASSIMQFVFGDMGKKNS